MANVNKPNEAAEFFSPLTEQKPAKQPVEGIPQLPSFDPADPLNLLPGAGRKSASVKGTKGE